MRKKSLCTGLARSPVSGGLRAAHSAGKAERFQRAMPSAWDDSVTWVKPQRGAFSRIRSASGG
jgi:hypothetical protein